MTATVISAVALVLTAAAGLGTAGVVFRSSKLKAIVDLGEIEREALTKSNARLTQDNVELMNRVAVLENERLVLSAVVTQKDAITALTGQLEIHHKETIAMLGQLVAK